MISFFDLVFTGSVSRDWVSPWNALYASIAGPAIKEAKSAYGAPPSPHSPALALAAYTGTFRNDYLGAAIVVEENDALVLKLGPRANKSFPLKHFNRDVFIYYPDAESPDVPSGVAFEVGPAQQAVRMTIDNLNDDGQGVLDRAKGK